MGVMKMEITAPRAGLEPTYSGIPGQYATIAPNKLP